MTDSDRDLAEIERAIAELLPKLSERLARHGLGEIEVTSGELRIRVAASGPRAEAAPAPPAQPGLALHAFADASTPARGPAPRAAPAPVAGNSDEPMPAAAGQGVSSPAVGYFVYGGGLGPGMAVDKGDALGYVEMLGVRHDVRAPRSGTVRNLVAESGEPVEYGQVVLDLAPAEGER
ncbi:MAG: acetyl-CoA carboxylase biotin carboxyl carrier protein [Candidatus Limnocylindria bacterium]